MDNIDYSLHGNYSNSSCLINSRPPSNLLECCSVEICWNLSIRLPWQWQSTCRPRLKSPKLWCRLNAVEMSNTSCLMLDSYKLENNYKAKRAKWDGLVETKQIFSATGSVPSDVSYPILNILVSPFSYISYILLQPSAKLVKLYSICSLWKCGTFDSDNVLQYQIHSCRHYQGLYFLFRHILNGIATFADFQVKQSVRTNRDNSKGTKWITITSRIF